MVRLQPRRLRRTPMLPECAKAFASPSSPEWCRKIVNDQSLIPIFNVNRSVKKSGEDSLIGGTLYTPETIPAWQAYYKFYNEDGSQPPETTPTPATSAAQKAESDAKPVASELISLVALRSGLNGHADLAHGGITGVILDEVTGTVAYLHMDKGASAMTAYLNITYKRPLPTPGIVLCRSWLEKVEGRKVWLRATVEDGKGNSYAEAECLYIQIKKPPQKL